MRREFSRGEMWWTVPESSRSEDEFVERLAPRQPACLELRFTIHAFKQTVKPRTSNGFFTATFTEPLETCH